MSPNNFIGAIAVAVCLALVLLACVMLAGWDGENRLQRDERKYMERGDYYQMMKEAERDE